MYKVIKDFTDHLKENYKYKAGDAYEEQHEKWTQFLVERGCIEKVVLEQKKKFFGRENEDVAEKQE